MCGLVGIYQPGEIKKQDLYNVEKMLNIIKHRGPDGRGIYFSESICIGSVRLSMLDSTNNYSLIENLQYNIILAYNGEIYNHRELRRYLEQKGYVFKTESDGEVIIYLYKEKGLKLSEDLDGMFAFALYDKSNESLLLGRDPLGIKPLYFSTSNSKITFASEIKAFLGINKQSLDSNALANYYNYRFIPAPRTIYKDIFKLEPGQYIYAMKDSINIKKYWSPTFLHEESTLNLEDIMNDAVLSTSQCDHNLGIFLSGGLDSSTILSILNRNSYKPTAFTIGYDCGINEDETSEASKIASHFNVIHKTTKLELPQLQNAINEVALFVDEPLYSTVAVSTYSLAKYASQYVKGILTGDGSDELFLGYEYLQRVIKLNSNKDIEFKNAYLSQIGWMNKSWRENLLDIYFRDQEGKDDIYAKFELDSKSALDSIRKFEICYRLPEYHLARVDRLTMAHGIEARVPFLRKDVVNWALNKTTADLLYNFPGKTHLKKSFKGTLPENIFKKKKQPFTTPIRNWIEGPLKSDIQSLVFESNYCHELGFNKKTLIQLVQNFYKHKSEKYDIIWGMYILLKWYENAGDFSSYN